MSTAAFQIERALHLCIASCSFIRIVQQRDTDDEVKDHIRQNLHLRERVRMLKLS